MAWVTITGDVVSTATKFGGTDHGNKIANMFNGVDVSDTVTINSAVTWTFENGSFYLRNPADTFSYLFTPSAIVANRTLTLPLLTGTDTVVVEALAQTLTNKTINTAHRLYRRLSPCNYRYSCNRCMEWYSSSISILGCRYSTSFSRTNSYR
jgi:hypothetical protein